MIDVTRPEAIPNRIPSLLKFMQKLKVHASINARNPLIKIFVPKRRARED